MTIFEAYNQTKQKLKKAGIEDFVFEAKQIIKHITGLNSIQILNNYNNSLSEFQMNNLTAIIRQREIRYPLQYIFGEWDFYGRSYYVGPGVLVPRADTETLIDVSLDFIKNTEEPQILDLCTGSGCIGITLALEKPESTVTLVDKFDEALKFAKKNIARYEAVNTTAVKGDVLTGDSAEDYREKFNLIVSNPPYIPESEMEIISPETKFEPQTALLADDNGMEFYKAIIANYTECLVNGGMLCFEVGIGEAQRVADLLKSAGYKDIKINKDLAGIDRAVSGIFRREG